MLLNKNNKLLNTYLRRFKIFFRSKLKFYSSKWITLSIDIFLINISFLFSCLIISEGSLNTYVGVLMYQLSLISLIGLFSFLVVGSYKGVIRHTGTRDGYNVLVAATLVSSILLFLVFTIKHFGIIESIRIELSVVIIH